MKNAHVRDIRVIDMLVIKVGYVRLLCIGTLFNTYMYTRARKIIEFHLAHWASNPQVLLIRGGTSPLAEVFKLINKGKFI